MRGFCEWRDPDSNWGHHDFQSSLGHSSNAAANPVIGVEANSSMVVVMARGPSAKWRNTSTPWRLHALARKVAPTHANQPAERTGLTTQLRRLETSPEHPAKSCALRLKGADGAGQAALALRRQPHQDDASV